MIINYKGLYHERTEDAPFIGALISSVDCHFNCKGCYNQHLKKIPTLSKEAEEIVREIKSNPFNDGIIFGGLEWSLQALELLVLAEEAKKNGLQVMIYTGFNSPELFQKAIGTAASIAVGEYEQIMQQVHTQEDTGIFQFIGAMILDETIGDYYLKCGMYDENLKGENIQFGISLASTNQKIYQFTKGKED